MSVPYLSLEIYPSDQIVMALIPQRVISGANVLYGRTTINGIFQNECFSWHFKPKQNCILQGTLAAGGDNLRISTYNRDTILFELFTPTPTNSLILYKDQDYVLDYVRIGATVGANLIVFSFIGNIVNLTSDYFENGFEASDITQEGLSYSVDGLGVAKFKFESSPVVANQQIILGKFDVALKSGQMSVTTNKPEFFEPYVQTFQKNNSIYVVLLAKKDGIVNANVTVGVDNLGVAIPAFTYNAGVVQ
jgi:hypothetical protein